MAPRNGNQPYLSEGQYQSTQERVAQLRQLLMQENASLLIANPQLADILNQRLNSLLSTIEGDGARLPGPADNGLSSLIGLGSEAATDINNTRVAPGVTPYDEAAPSQRIIAMGHLYYIHQVGEMAGAFRAVSTLQELYKGGVVRLADGVGAYRLYQFDRKQVLRYTAMERLQAYLRAFGYRAPVYGLPPGSSVPPARWASANTQFHPLFNAFIAEVANFFRDKRISEVVRERANDPSFGSIARVRRVGLDLRNNLKNFSYGHLTVLRIETMQLLEEAFEILQADDVRALFGAQDAWDVIEDVLRRYHNQHINVSPRSIMGISGRGMLQWLAQSHILRATRAEFEALAQDIAEPAEEWLASAQTVGVAVRTPETIRGTSVAGISLSR